MIQQNDLLRAMCIRSAYGVKIDTHEHFKNGSKRIATLTAVNVHNKTYDFKETYSQAVGVPLFYNGKPTCTMFLRSLSTMTPEEIEIFEGYKRGVLLDDTLQEINEMFHWLLSSKFDLEGLIPQGAAYEATPEIYSI